MVGARAERKEKTMSNLHHEIVEALSVTIQAKKEIREGLKKTLEDAVCEQCGGPIQPAEKEKILAAEPRHYPIKVSCKGCHPEYEGTLFWTY